MTGHRSVSVLLVEDDEVDVEAMRRAFRLAGVDRPITVAGDGLEALALLRGEGGRPPLPRPILVVLDLNLPRMKGTEFLAELGRDPALRCQPVFVLTTSDDERHKAEAYRRNATGYFVKPHDTRRLVEVARFLDDFCNLVEPPPPATTTSDDAEVDVPQPPLRPNSRSTSSSPSVT